MEVLLDYIYNLNWFAVVVAASVGTLVHAVWYSDALFGKPWLKATKLKKKDLEKDGVSLALVISFITMIISTAALAVLVDVLVIRGALAGVLLGVLVSFGFIVTNNGMSKLQEQRPFTLFAISAVGDMLTMAVIGAVLAVW